MLVIVILTYILATLHVAAAVSLWGWMSVHWFLTLLMVVFLA
jgi:hypothetical protein